MGWVKCQHRVGESGLIPNIFAGENISRIHSRIKAKSFKQCFLLFRNFCFQRLWCWKGNSQVTSTSQIHFCQGIAIFWGDFPILFWRFPGWIPCLLLPRSISAGIFLLNKPCFISVLCRSNVTDSNRVSRISKERKPTANQPRNNNFRSLVFPIFVVLCPNFSICQIFFFPSAV